MDFIIRVYGDTNSRDFLGIPCWERIAVEQLVSSRGQTLLQKLKQWRCFVLISFRKLQKLRQASDCNRNTIIKKARQASQFNNKHNKVLCMVCTGHTCFPTFHGQCKIRR